MNQGPVVTGAGNWSFSVLTEEELRWEISLGLVSLTAPQGSPGLGSM